MNIKIRFYQSIVAIIFSLATFVPASASVVLPNQHRGAAEATAIPARVSRYVNGASVDVSGSDICATGSSKKAANLYDSRYDTGSSIRRYVFRAASPTAAGSAISVRLELSSAARVTLYGPTGLITSDLPATFTYFTANAQPGLYALLVAGPAVASGSDCGWRRTTNTNTITWTGTLSYTPFQDIVGLFKTKSNTRTKYVRACRPVPPTAVTFSC